MGSFQLIHVVLICVIAAISSERRLVLHSDTDVVTEINKLRTELNDQRNIVQTLTSNLFAKDAEIAFLRITQNKQDVEMRNLSSNINAKDTEIASLKVNQSKQDIEMKNINSNINDKAREIASLIANQYKQGLEIANLTKTLVKKDLENLALKTEQQTFIRNITTTLRTNSLGSTYVRWGKNDCPGNGTSLAYFGYMASAKYSETGGASNYLCLAGQPTWDYYDDAGQGEAYVYGVEYNFNGHTATTRAKFFGTDIYNDNAPCAVCYRSRSTNIMIPGRKTCYGGWTKEYSGYIVTGYPSHTHQTEYICLDRRPDVVVGGKTSDDESFLVLVEGKCGKSLECPPYVNGRELSCVVCSI